MKVLQESEVISVTEFNTNNAWGFGGGVGKEYAYKSGAKVRTGRAYYRHTGSTPFYVIRDRDGNPIYDERFAPNPKSKAYDLCNRVLKEGI